MMIDDFIMHIAYVLINVKPHYPPPGLTRGLVGDFDPV